MKFYLTFIAVLACFLPAAARPKPAILYHNNFKAQQQFPELVLAGNNMQFIRGGLNITGPGLVRLDKYYSLARITSALRELCPY